MGKKRRSYTPEQKVSILREHLLEGHPVSQVCDRHRISPSTFYEWQRKLFEGGPAAFRPQRDREKEQLAEKVQALEARLAHKDHVIARVTEEFVKAKKELGDP